MSTFYGVDTHCVTDLSLIDQLVTDPRKLIGERIVRLWTINPGALGVIGDDPSRGINVRQLVNQKSTPATRIDAQFRLQSEAIKDEQVQDCSVEMTFSGDVLAIASEVDSSAGPFQMTTTIDGLTVKTVFNFG